MGHVICRASSGNHVSVAVYNTVCTVCAVCVSLVFSGADTKVGPGARCSSVVRAFAHGAMGRRIDRSLVSDGNVLKMRRFLVILLKTGVGLECFENAKVF